MKDEPMMQEIGKPQNCVMHTSYTQYFTINHNTITRSSGKDSSWKMVLLDVEPGVFSFRTHIHQRKGWMLIGVTDKVTQKGRDSA